MRDSAAILDATHGPAPGDPYRAPPPGRDFLHEVAEAPKNLRIGLWTEGLDGEPIDPECVRAAEAAGGMLAELGHEVTPGSPPVSGSESTAALRVVMAAHTANTVGLRAAATSPEPAPEVENITRLLAEEGNRISGRNYADALATIHRIGRQLARFFEGFDALLSPTLADPPLMLGAMDMMTTDLDGYLERMLGHLAFTPLYNLAGCPAASLPLHMTPDGLPVGVQLGAAYGDEATLIRLSAQLEQAHPWWDRRPSLISV